MGSPQSNSRALQQQIERHTLDLFREPRVQHAKQRGERALLASIPDPDAESLARFPEIATEITLNALIGLADGYTGEDLPRLIMRPPRLLDGAPVPGNRGLHDNPDTFYRLVPLDDRSNFVLEGAVPRHPATIFEISALTSRWHTLCNLSKSDLAIAPDSHFRIHFGPEPGPACDHFVELTPDAEMLLVRETLADWARETPSRLRTESFVDRGGPRAQDDDAFLEAAAARVDKWFRESIRLTEVPLSQPANHFPAPVISGEHGKLVTMAYSIGHYHVRPGEALVFTIEPGSAPYVVAPMTNLWGTTGATLARGASWNSSQVKRNTDGTFSCVLSLADPGVHNWLDPDRLERGFLFFRWAGLDPVAKPERAPALSTRLVPIADLREVLPAETVWVDPSQRASIQSQREHDHALRYREFEDE